MKPPNVTYETVRLAIMGTPSGIYVKDLKLTHGETWQYYLTVTFLEKWQLDIASRGRVLASFQDAVDAVVPAMLKVDVVES